MKTATNKKTKAQAIDKINNLELPSSPALQFVPLELIETAIQIRTEFNQESIEELAGDIKARGMLQPVLLRPLAGGKFLMIAGERRLRAARFAELDNIPALIGEVDDETAALMQLAENIHREELNIQDECQAIKKLYDNLGSLDKVAQVVKKSKPWVSKRYAMTHTKLHYVASNLLADGITEDIELLKALSALANILGWTDGKMWAAKITKGTAGRDEVRAALKEAKEIEKEIEKEAKAAANKRAEKVSHAKPKEPPPPPPWTINNAMEDLSQALNYTDNDLSAADLLNTWTEEQRGQIEARFNSAAEKGKNEGLSIISALIFDGWYSSDYIDIELLAMIEGYSGKPFHWMEFLAKLQVPREKA